MVSIDESPLPNILGFLSLASYIVTLIPTILRILFPQTKETGIPQWLLKRRRIIGIIAFFLALGHGFLMVQKRNFDFLDIKTFWIYIQGISTFIIFTLLSITSNNWSVKKLKKNWKQLHKLTYVAMVLLIWHIWDKMSGHWTYLTPISLVATTIITVLFLIRLWIEHQGKQQKNANKVTKADLAEKSTSTTWRK
ncbi:ferric reductase-like transmembrane domain-containing protein [Nostoc sp. UHCC 0926]|uniref:ferric reductase-like transmembrane domain-containing protein n=1 Tax=unclassified Nostoc TaxID=2593658 RepID=UPI0023607D06|nr:ferric reductase-like transmembrane domain-containing protein [Nostoc sp. UHCC 0926]WDD32681.1 ferric reductase-like transmembrane domain-containing protein [Nostoc sp. UHCC 0926]